MGTPSTELVDLMIVYRLTDLSTRDRLATV